jgi:hypothetical protein
MQEGVESPQLATLTVSHRGHLWDGEEGSVRGGVGARACAGGHLCRVSHSPPWCTQPPTATTHPRPQPTYHLLHHLLLQGQPLQHLLQRPQNDVQRLAGGAGLPGSNGAGPSPNGTSVAEGGLGGGGPVWGRGGGGVDRANTVIRLGGGLKGNRIS